MASRLALMGAVPFAANLVPMLALPVVARVAGAEGWAALAVGQSAGMLALIVVDYGWSIRGPIEVARADAAARRRLYLEHLVTGVPMLLLAGGVAALVSAAAAPDGHRLLAAFMALSVASGGVASAWYIIGSGRASHLFYYDVAPRSAALAVGVVMMLTTQVVWWYPAMILVGAIASTVLFAIRVGRPHGAGASPRNLLRQRLRGNAAAAAINSSGGAYTYGAIVVVGASSTASVTVEASSADRLFKIGTLAISALTNALQAWVVEDGPEAQRGRQRTSILAHVVLGVVGGLGLAVLGSWATRILFGPEVTSGTPVVAWYGLAFAILAVNSCLNRHVLMVADRDRAVLLATLTGAFVGLPAVLVGVTAYGAAGAAAGFAAGEGAVLLVQLVMLLRGRGVRTP